MKIYISGKIGGLEYNEAFVLFSEAEAEARRVFGKVSSVVEVINPMKKVSETLDWTWCEYLREDIKILCDCAGIYMLNNWRDSKGASLELDVAKALGLAVVYQDGGK